MAAFLPPRTRARYDSCARGVYAGCSERPMPLCSALPDTCPRRSPRRGSTLALLLLTAAAGSCRTTIRGWVTSAARGAFTRPDVEQLALLVMAEGELLPACCNKANALLVLEAGQVLHVFSLPASAHAGTTIEKAVDVDRDGTAELLLETTTAWSGASKDVQLVSVRSGTLSWLGPRRGWSLYSLFMADFEHASCKVLHVTPGLRPIFSLRPRPGGCS